jgi:hypothetical protein
MIGDELLEQGDGLELLLALGSSAWAIRQVAFVSWLSRRLYSRSRMARIRVSCSSEARA